MTLSSIATIIIEDYLPDAHRKYVFQNFQQTPHYRSYNDTIPTYLHGRPRNVILHCLDRKGNSNKFTSEDIEDIDAQQGVFSVHSSKGKVYTVNFGTNSEDKMPNCTCADWRTHHIPCKHFFTMFQHRASWQWHGLPKEYLASAYISIDKAALLTHDTRSLDPIEHDDLADSTCDVPGPATDVLPKRVCY